MTNDEREAIRREAREAALREAAEAASRVGQPVGAGDGFGTVVPGTSGDARRAILALIDTPAPPPPAPPAGDVLRMSQTLADIAAGRGMFGIDLKADLEWAMWEARAALAAAPDPQPDADEREAMVAAIRQGFLDWLKDDTDDRSEWQAIADALLAAGWTRKREEG